MASIGLDQPLLTDHDFERVRRLIYEYAGISLSEHKRNMVYNRLARRLRACGHSAFARYLDVVQSERSQEREAFVNALTTNLTAFFREAHHFELLAARARDWRKPNAAPRIAPGVRSAISASRGAPRMPLPIRSAKRAPKIQAMLGASAKNGFVTAARL